MAKVVTVVKEHLLVYEVESGPGEKLTDEQAIDMVKARMQTQSPLGLVSDEETTKKFKVREKGEEGNEEGDS